MQRRHAADPGDELTFHISDSERETPKPQQSTIPASPPLWNHQNHRTNLTTWRTDIVNEHLHFAQEAEDSRNNPLFSSAPIGGEDA